MLLLTRRQTILAALATSLAGRTALAQSASAKVRIALDWTPNTNHIGIYVAKAKGFYAAAGLDVEILPFTDTSAGTLVSNGVADFGISSEIEAMTQRAGGGDVKMVYGVVQTETARLIYKGGRDDIKSPKDLDGKTYGGFGGTWESALISAMIRNDGGTGDVKTVTLGTSAYEALDNGSVDFTLEIYTWEGIAAELENRKLGRFRYSDYGIPDEQTTVIVSSDAYLAVSREHARAFIQATRQGYAYSVDHPDEACDLLISNSNGALMNTELVKASQKALIDGHFLKSEAGVIGTIDPAKADAIGAFLLDNGILVDANGAALKEKPDFSTYYTNELLG
ncbi:ABC transporter substrate-binding protein [Rhizobium lentis]|uniref:Thiamine pyrimidine synthase n=1 Tax=Rhizobium lentis TaxID=1138194 RepID=A0A7W8XFX8_9HYPH|nr:ABC transporter substrate-binding protein [Rhizobium lentis]MBB4575079.1 ABC-type nitrate/sulfonate/bicarbonate transport system substrate-binding protein [Rhizobium lentis]MBB5551388.1 ABC-type nitrate/sulfonate/bicarbonate transport system substrate-binding protein [Rhizobium lentis]MBB5562116.1 ABC-type nitrate/sulfonate/bicarbonate transport system substrate-binding protein [Rhizobium lentis]MBB5568699.1 ABC-type nitrate/sulfonate/bicarbonate transport system substrate-binding protein [R